MKNRLFRLDVLSGIDDDIIDRVSARRAMAMRTLMLARRRFITVAVAAALCICLAAGSVIGLMLAGGKQAPEYLGISVSGEYGRDCAFTFTLPRV